MFGVLHGNVLGPSKILLCKGYRPLLILWGIGVVECLKQGPDDWLEVGASREVHGAFPEIAPKRRSQLACGLTHSA